MLVAVDNFPVQNGGAAIANVVDSVGDDAARVARTLSSWYVSRPLVSNPVGDDYYGSRVLEQLKNSGLDVSQKVRKGVSTPLVVETGLRTSLNLGWWRQ